MNKLIHAFIALLTLILAMPNPGLAETWPSLDEYVERCVLIVKCKTEIEEEGRDQFRVLESWKGKFSSDLFYNNPQASEKPRDGCIFAERAHGNDDPVNGREVIFFFTKRNQPSFAKGKLVSHSTCFNINDGKLVYASTDNPRGHRKEYTLDEFKKAVAEIVERQAKKKKKQEKGNSNE